MRKVVLLLLAGSLHSPLFSQVLNGRILTESGSLGSAVSVRFQNGANSIVSNADGSFSIRAKSLPDTLVFSGVGLEPYKVVITEKNIKDPAFEVVLLKQRAMLDEVVVTGYGSTHKKAMTGSAAVFKEGKDSEKPVLAYEEVSVSSKPASPSLRIRGVSSGSGSVSASVKNGRGLFMRDTAVAPREGILAKSGVLSAGEVNDFTKWKMWEDYAAGEFKALSALWGMQTNNRFSVQLTNKQLNAVVNEPVYLLQSSTGDTVWKAVTDNTGKAELWGGFLQKNNTVQAGDYYITDRNGNVLRNPSSFANGMNRLATGKRCELSNEADIAFVVDATGSMGDEIEFLKLELEDVVRRTLEKNSTLNVRTAAVFYRDTRDDYVTLHSAFNEDMLKALNFIKLQSAAGGGDFPEAVDAALSTAIDSLEWNPRARTRLLFLVLDAPPHAEAKERIQQLTVKAAALGIRIVPVACSGTDKSTEFLLRSMALATNGTYAFLTNHSGVGNAHIEPTTDKYAVELLNSLLQRVISQFLYAGNCDKTEPVTTNYPDTRQPENLLGVKIYPNPTTGRFVIESKKDLKEIFVADFSGKIIQKLGTADKKGRWSVDIGQYPAGTYLVKYITADNKWGAEKVVLMH